MNDKKAKAKDRLRGTSLQTRLFLYVAIFFLSAIILLWVFQVLLMDVFYRTVTVRGLADSSERLSRVCESAGDIEGAVYEESSAKGVCVSVYMIHKNFGSSVAEAHVHSGCYIHTFIREEGLRELYTKTLAQGGTLVSDIMDGKEDKRLSSIVYSRTVSSPSGDYLILFNADTYPESAITATISVQLGLITAVFIAGAVILAAVMSRRISAPVSRLCDEAERLAMGDYSLDPPVSGIRELDRLSYTLSYAAEELDHANSLQRELVANITHDLRTPLTLISGYGEVMRDIPGEVTPENLQVIIDESHRLSALVSDVLEISKSRSGQITVNKKLFSLTDSVAAETERYRVLLAPMGYTVRYEWDGTPVTVNGDESKLLQVFCNLMNNAANFTGTDKVITVRQYVKDGVCRTQVIDNGEGIPEDQLPSIWDRYYRVRDRHTKGLPGTGLGLSIVKELLLAHGLEFGVSSACGKGSSFWFEVPTEVSEEMSEEM